MSDDINTHNLICDFGRHKGVPYTRMPISYLKWLANTPAHHAHKIGAAELKRRGTTTPDLDVSGHAIDRASLNCRKIWHESRGPDEGIHAWLCRMSAEALKEQPDKQGRYHYNGMVFCFEQDGIWPVLKTVMRHKEKLHEPD